MTTTTKRSHIHYKLAKSVLSGASLLAVIISTLFFVSEFKRSADKTVVMLNQLLDTVESTAAIAAYTGNQQIGDDVLKGLLRNDIVHQARLENGRQLDLKAVRNTEVPNQDEIVRTLHSPFADNEVVGRLMVVPEARFTLEEARHSTLVGVINSITLIAVTALMVLALVRSYLSRPLLRVSDRLHAIMAGEQKRLDNLSRHQDDELGQLVEDINRLLDNLKEKFLAEHELRQEIQLMERKLRNIFDTTSAGIFQLDCEGNLITANPPLRRVLRLPPSAPVELVGGKFLHAAFSDPERVQELMRQAEQHDQPVSGDLMLKNPQDAPNAWVHCLLSKQTDTDGQARFEGVVYDITERHAAERRTRHEADHDSLTGLVRRHVAQRFLDQHLNATPAEEKEAQVVLLLDLDGFKDVNDRHGHKAGDQVLVETAKRLKACVRVGDVVARLGGDEFLIILVNCIPADHAWPIARELVTSVRRPIQINPELAVNIGVSIGIAVSEASGLTTEDLLRTADRAMYAVKHQGKNGFGIVRPDGTVEVHTVPQTD